jgi:hypothetical protein
VRGSNKSAQAQSVVRGSNKSAQAQSVVRGSNKSAQAQSVVRGSLESTAAARIKTKSNTKSHKINSLPAQAKRPKPTGHRTAQPRAAEPAQPKTFAAGAGSLPYDGLNPV